MSLATNMPCGVHVDPVVDSLQETKFVRWKHNSRNLNNHKDQSRPTVPTVKPQKASRPALPETRQTSRHSAVYRVRNLVNLQSSVLLG